MENLKRIDNKNEYILYMNPKLKELNTLRRLFWENVELFFKVSKDIDLLFIPGFSPSFIKFKKTIVVVHDLIGILFPQNLGWMSRFYWSKWLPFCVKKADIIVCDSYSTKRDCLRLLTINPDKLKVVYPGVDHSFFSRSFSSQEKKEVLRKFKIFSDYILFVGTIEPRKNLIRLLEAWRYIEQKYDILLVIAGKKDWGYKEVLSKIIKLNLKRVIFTDYITEEEKLILYKNCQFFIYPSLYEGFGLPVLEAMASKKAVICSNVSSLPEITSDSALLVNPYKESEILEALKLFIENKSLREEFSFKGYKRSLSFSWKKTALNLLEIFNF